MDRGRRRAGLVPVAAAVLFLWALPGVLGGAAARAASAKTFGFNQLVYHVSRAPGAELAAVGAQRVSIRRGETTEYGRFFYGAAARRGHEQAMRLRALGETVVERSGTGWYVLWLPGLAAGGGSAAATAEAMLAGYRPNLFTWRPLFDLRVFWAAYPGALVLDGRPGISASDLRHLLGKPALPGLLAYSVLYAALPPLLVWPGWAAATAYGVKVLLRMAGGGGRGAPEDRPERRARGPRRRR